jgi:hypothetical protein
MTFRVDVSGRNWQELFTLGTCEEKRVPPRGFAALLRSIPFRSIRLEGRQHAASKTSKTQQHIDELTARMADGMSPSLAPSNPGIGALERLRWCRKIRAGFDAGNWLV